jgi:hypothetical protein
MGEGQKLIDIFSSLPRRREPRELGINRINETLDSRLRGNDIWAKDGRFFSTVLASITHHSLRIIVP